MVTKRPCIPVAQINGLRDDVHSDQHSHAHSSKIFIMVAKRFQ